MAYISMRGAGGVGEIADFLRERFSRDCALAEELRRVEGGAGSAFLLFESSCLFTRGVELLALNISGDGENVTVDAFGHGCGSIWADEDALPLYARAALSERGFVENERDCWRIAGDAGDGGGESAGQERTEAEAEYVSPMELAKLGAAGGKKDAHGVQGEAVRAEKRRKKRGKQDYDPEL